MKPVVKPILALTGSLLFIFSCKHEPLFNVNPTPQQSTSCSPDSVYFQQQVLPIFISNCAMSGCHDQSTHKEGLILSSYSTIMSSGTVIPFKPGSSKAYKLIMENNIGDRMPPLPASALTPEQKDLIYKWILQGAINNACQGNCDSSLFTYAAAIKPIITNKCQGCHSGSAPGGGGIDLTSYINVKFKVDDGKLWGSVNHMPGYSAMPKGGQKLTDCELGQIKKWIDAGALNN